MKRRRLLWQLYISYVWVIFGLFVALAGYHSRTVKQFCERQIEQDLEAREALLAESITDCLEHRPDQLDALCKRLGERSGTRLTVIRPDGTVAADSDAEPADMENHGSRPEVVEAYTRGVGMRMRFSHTLQRRMMYVAAPLSSPAGDEGILRLALPIDRVDAVIATLRSRLTVGGLILTVLAMVFSLVLAGRISRPLEDMRRAAEQFGRGELETRVAVDDSEEVHALAEALNRMAEQLADRMRTVAEQRNELEAVLSSMAEGVLAIDADERVVRLNRAAAELFHADPEESRGRLIQEVIRNSALQRFISDALETTQQTVGDIVLLDPDERYLQVHGTPLEDADGTGRGVLIVLADVTRLRRLENVRRDFVGNVSHELKTPVTSIKGFIETLLDNSPDDPGEVQRFLQIVQRQSERLETIIEDLLVLSRLDQDEQSAEVERRVTALAPVLCRAVQDCAVKADEREVKLTFECAEGLAAELNEALLEEAVVNLLDNAIKYSDLGGTVELTVTAGEGELQLAVTDHGGGIAPEHHARLFERFYRVDQARSRELGGTGLGLAIVKHIAKVHHGRAEVESELGHGSTFSIYLPAAPEQA